MKKENLNKPLDADNSSPLGAGGIEDDWNWNKIYALVAGTLLILIVLFYAFTLYFA